MYSWQFWEWGCDDDIKVVNENRKTKDERRGPYTCRHSRNRTGFLLTSVHKNLSAFLPRKTGVGTHPTPVFPVSRAIRYNTLHLASKVVCQRVPLWKPPKDKKWLSIFIFRQNKSWCNLSFHWTGCTVLFCSPFASAAVENPIAVSQNAIGFS